MFVQYFTYVKYSGVLNTFVMAFCYQQNYFRFPAVVWAERGTFSRE